MPEESSEDLPRNPYQVGRFEKSDRTRSSAKTRSKNTAYKLIFAACFSLGITLLGSYLLDREFRESGRPSSITLLLVTSGAPIPLLYYGVSLGDFLIAYWQIRNRTRSKKLDEYKEKFENRV